MVNCCWLQLSSPCVCLQWSFGVTCWEIFSTAKTPYPGIHPTSLIAQLENGERLPMPSNAACCDSMYVIILDVSTKDTNMYKSVIVVVVCRTSNRAGMRTSSGVNVILHRLRRGGVLQRRTLFEALSSNIIPGTRVLNVYKAKVAACSR